MKLIPGGNVEMTLVSHRLVRCAIASASLSLLVLIQGASAASKPNVLLICIDDLNDWVGCLDGHPQAETPNIDRLASRGMLFTNAHCQAPICQPSRTSFMSGFRPSTSGVYGNKVKYDAKGEYVPGQDAPWMTKRFEQAGYQVFTAGKVLHRSQNQPLGGISCFKTGQGPYPPNKINVPKRITPQPIWDIGPYPETEEQYTDLRIANWTIDNINQPEQEGDKPRFMALGFYNPHLPLFAPKKWFDAAPSRQEVLLAPVKENDYDDLPEISRRIHTRVGFKQCARWCLAEETNLRLLTQAYLSCTSAMDDCMGRVIDALDNSEMDENTWIVVLSDHGWHLGEKDHIAKQTLWTRSTRVPMIIVPPKRMKEMPRGVRCDRPVELVDIYPTLVAAAELKPVDTDRLLDGLSLLQWLADPAAEKDRPALTTIYAHNHSLVGDRYRYTRYADGSEELYDRINDPLEYDNLIGESENNPDLQAAVKRLSSYLPDKQAGEPDLVTDRVKN